jgi:hypothetical protein
MDDVNRLGIIFELIGSLLAGPEILHRLIGLDRLAKLLRSTLLNIRGWLSGKLPSRFAEEDGTPLWFGLSLSLLVLIPEGLLLGLLCAMPFVDRLRDLSGTVLYLWIGSFVAFVVTMVGMTLFGLIGGLLTMLGTASDGTLLYLIEDEKEREEALAEYRVTEEEDAAQIRAAFRLPLWLPLYVIYYLISIVGIGIANAIGWSATGLEERAIRTTALVLATILFISGLSLQMVATF